MAPRSSATGLWLAALATLTAASCRPPTDVTHTGPPGTITAQVVASDVSQPTGPNGAPISVSGTATFSGLTVELWNGSLWLMVTNGAAGTATLALGNGAVQATLVPATAIPAGSYSKARLTAKSASLDVSVGTLQFSARTQSTTNSFTVEKPVVVTVNTDGSRTFSIQLTLIRTVTLSAVSGVPTVTLAGDFGTIAVPATTAPASVVAADASQPATTPSGMAVSGTVKFTGLTVDLWDGKTWWPVTGGSGTATLALENGAALVTLVPARALPAGTYSEARLTATDAVLDITASENGHTFTGEIQATTGGQPVVVVKTVTVTVNADGSRTFAIQLQVAQAVALQVDAATGAASVSVTGDLGTRVAPAAMH